MKREEEKSNHPPRVTYAVYYDGSCPVCTLTMDTVKKTARNESFAMHDVTREELPMHIDKEQAMKEIHVTSSDGTTYTNADAVLVMLSTYRGLAWIFPIGMLPGIRGMLRALYQFVATNRYFLLGTMSPVFWSKTIVVLGLILGICLSLPLWSAERAYPLTPVFSFTDTLSLITTPLLLIISLVLLVVSLIHSRPSRVLLLLCICIGMLVLMDQSRLQPWVYHYLATLLILSSFSWDPKDTVGKERVLSFVRFIVATMYFWSGIQKLNINFIEHVFPWMVSSVIPLASASSQMAVVLVGLLVPFIEIAIGVGLLVDKLRAWAIIGAFSMCAFVLICIGPFGHSWNEIVWPWNIALFFLVCILFSQKESISIRTIFTHIRGWLGTFVIILFGIMPVFYFVNVWDAYPSWSLYSGTPNEATFYLNESVIKSLPLKVQTLVVRDETGQNTLEALDWSYSELKVPPYPEERIFLSILASLCTYAEYPDDVTLVMRGRLVPFFQHIPEHVSCNNLISSHGSILES